MPLPMTRRRITAAAEDRLIISFLARTCGTPAPSTQLQLKCASSMFRVVSRVEIERDAQIFKYWPQQRLLCPQDGSSGGHALRAVRTDCLAVSSL